MLNDTQIEHVRILIKEEIIKLNGYLNHSIAIKYRQKFNNSINFYEQMLKDLGEE